MSYADGCTMEVHGVNLRAQTPPLCEYRLAKTHVGTRPCGLRQTAVGKDPIFAVLPI